MQKTILQWMRTYMNKNERKILDDFVDRVKRSVESLAGIVLYSSMARGEQTRSSDIDLLVIVDQEDPQYARKTIATLLAGMDQERNITARAQVPGDERKGRGCRLPPQCV